MARHLVAAIALAACAGCATTGGKVTAIIGAAAAGGAALAFAATDGCDRNPDDAVVLCTSEAGTGVMLGVVAGLSFLTSMIIEICSAPDLPPAPPQAAGAPPSPLAPPGLTPVSGGPSPTRNP